MKASITTAQAMSHPDVVLTINTLGKMADELRAALAERDAEIDGWKADQKENLADQCNLQGTINLQRKVIAAQRKVLEQAGDALNRFVYVECHQLSHHGKKEMHDFDKPCPVAAKVQAAITAIQEQLK